MSMEPFDYLSYKKSKQEALFRQKEDLTKKRSGIYKLCILTFAACFIGVLFVIGSKSSKIDIEYGRFGNNTAPIIEPENIAQNEEYTIDRRLFLIQGEEKAPSKSKTIEKTQQEVISYKDFEKFKANDTEKVEKPLKKEPEKPVENNKVAIKPKLPEKPVVKELGAIEPVNTPTKVLIGRYSTIEEAKAAQESLSDLIEGVPFVKKMNNYYSIQIGAYENFEVAKATALKYHSKGLDTWILE